MALRDKLRERVQPALEPGEQIRGVFMAQGGPSPWFSLLSYWIVVFGAKYRIVAATDRRLAVFKASSLVPSKVKEHLYDLPVGTRIGPVEGKLWGKATLGSERVWVHRRFHGDVAAIDMAAK